LFGNTSVERPGCFSLKNLLPFSSGGKHNPFPMALISIKGSQFEARSIQAASAFPPRSLPSTDDSDTLRLVKGDAKDLTHLSLMSKLTPQQCLNILRMALAGDLYPQNDLNNLMLDTWPTYRTASHQLREAASYAKYNVNPNCEEGEEPSKTAIEKAGLVSRAMKSFDPNPFNDEKGFSGMIYNFTDALLNGISMEEILWRKSKSKEHGLEWLPKASVWVNPRHLTFTDNGQIGLVLDGIGELHNQLEFNKTSQRYYKQPDENVFICSQFMSKSGSPLGAGFMRPLVWYWAARQFNNEACLVTARQFGNPFLDITYKAGTMTPTEIATLNELAKVAGANRRLVHPEGTTAVVVPPTALGKENPQRYLNDEANKACLYLLLGQSGTTESTPGKLGNDDTHMDVKQERVVGVANWVARTSLRQFARQVLRWNYGTEDECPEILPDFTKPLSSTEAGTLMVAVKNSGMAVRADELYKKVGFTKPDEGDIVVINGVEQIHEDPKTQEEMQQAELEQQEAQMEMSARYEQEPVQGRDRVRASGTSEGSKKGWEHRLGTGKKDLVASEAHLIERTRMNQEKGADEKKNYAVAYSTEAHRDSADAFKSGGKAKHYIAESKHRLAAETMERLHTPFGNEKATEHRAMQKRHAALQASVQASEPRTILATATDEELDELEALVKAAESAPYLNGEAEQVKAKLAELAR
jgi:hypothetical protein